MARILLVPFGSPGHTVPFTALGVALRERGHEVQVFLEPERHLDVAGLATVTPARWRFAGGVPPELIAAADAQALFRFMFFGSVVDMTQDVAAAAQDGGTDLIIGDVFMPGAGLAGELTGLPWVSMSCCPIPSLDAYRAYIPAHVVACFDATTTRAALDLPPTDGENLLGRISPLRHIILSTPMFSGFADLPAQVCLVGPLVNVPGQPIGGRSAEAGTTIVVTTTTNPAESLGGRDLAQRRYLAVTAAAVADLPIRAVVTRPAGALPTALAHAPPNVTCLAPTAHDELFDAATAVVCHAGWGTVGRALMRGLPLVAVPIIGDQFYIARRCEELGLGIALDATRMSVDDMRDAVRAVCEDSTYRKAASEIADDFRAAAPIDTCLSIVELLLARKG